MKVLPNDLNSTSLNEAIFDVVCSQGMENYKVTTSDYNSRDGLIGLPIKLTIEGSTLEGKTKVLHLFYKTASKVDCVRNGFPINSVFKREKFLYDVVLEAFRKFEKRKGIQKPFTNSIAKCFKVNDIDMDEFVLMEDLSKLGYFMLNRNEVMNEEHLEMSVREMARFHALSFAYRDQLPSKFKIIEEGTSDILQMIYTFTNFYDILEEKCKQTANCLDQNQEPIIYEKFKKFAFKEAKAWLKDVSQTNSNESVVLHGDCWSNNLMFKYKDENRDAPEKIAFIDWQHSGLGSPVIDLSYFLFTACTKPYFRNMDKYLKMYHDTLSGYISELGSNGNSIFPCSTFKRHWEEYAKFGLILSTVVIHGMVLKTQEEMPSLLEYAESDKHFSEMFLFKNASEDSNREYQERMTEVIRYCVDNNFI